LGGLFVFKFFPGAPERGGKGTPGQGFLSAGAETPGPKLRNYENKQKPRWELNRPVPPPPTKNSNRPFFLVGGRRQTLGEMAKRKNAGGGPKFGGPPPRRGCPKLFPPPPQIWGAIPIAGGSGAPSLTQWGRWPPLGEKAPPALGEGFGWAAPTKKIQDAPLFFLANPPSDAFHRGGKRWSAQNEVVCGGQLFSLGARHRVGAGGGGKPQPRVFQLPPHPAKSN